MKKRMRLIILLLAIVALVVIVLLVVTIGLMGVGSMDKHEFLTKKFYIPIKESYEIVFFENVTGDALEKHCYSELKVSESEYNELKLEIEKSEYSRDSLDWYDIYFENNSDWISSERVIEAYSKHVTETRYLINNDRIHINIFITEAKDGYRQVYMSRN